MEKFWKIFKWMVLVIILFLLSTYVYKQYQGYKAAKLVEESVIDVACVGDSNTYHYGGNKVKELNYTYHLSRMMGDQYKVKNYGMPGTCVQSDLETPYTDTRAYEASVEFEADVLIIMLGTNDIWDPGWRDEETFYQHYIQFLDTYLVGEVKPEVFLCTIPEVYAQENEYLGYGYQDKVAKINTVIERIALERGYELIDIYENTLLHPEWYEEDGIHLNRIAAKEVAHIIFEEINGN